MAHTQSYARSSEQTVATYLREHQYSVCTTNFTTRYGEIDIIAHEGDTYVFVEVKARKTPSFATSTTITPKKQSRMIHTAKIYMHQHGLTTYSARFDVALVTGTQEITYIPAAFAPEDSII